jgi:multiple sugar transport system substrate-binding protein
MSKPAWVTRRDFLKKTGTVAAVAAVGGTILSGCGEEAPAPTAPPEEAPVEEAPAEEAPAEEAPAEEAPAEEGVFVKRGEGPLHFVGWQYHPEIVEENVGIFMEMYGEEVDYELIAADYHPVAETKFIGGERIDMCYSEEDHLNRWYKAAWVKDIHDYPGVEDIYANMYESGQKSQTLYDGKRAGLPYYSGFMSTWYNDMQMDELGAEAAPEDWTELLAMAEEMKAKGVSDYPYLGDWARDWWALSWEVTGNIFAEGAEYFDDNNDPTFAGDPLYKEVIERYKYIFDNELTVPDALTIKDPNVTMFTGEICFYQNHDYQIKVANEDPETSKAAGHLHMFMAPGRTHQTFAWTAMYLEGAENLDDERVWDLHQFFGGKNKEGNYEVAKKWVKYGGLGTPHKDVYDDPEVLEMYSTWVDTDMRAAQAELGRDRSMGRSLWYPEWDNLMVATLQEYILGDKTYEEYETLVSDKALELNAALPF